MPLRFYAKFTCYIMNDYNLKGVKTMFNRKDLIVAIALSLMGGYVYGYSKAREKFVTALAKESFEKAVADEKNKES